MVWEVWLAQTVKPWQIVNDIVDAGIVERIKLYDSVFESITDQDVIWNDFCGSDITSKLADA